MNEQMKQLAEPFDPKFVKFRVGATNKDKTEGLALAYIDARDVQNRLDDVAGTDWSDSYRVLGKGSEGLEVECQLTIFGVTRTDAGIGDNAKDAYSDALKRAAVKFGVGRYLYGLPKEWKVIQKKGQSYVLKSNPALPHWALPYNYTKTPVKEKPQQPNSTPDEKEGFVLEVRTPAQNRQLHALGRALYGDEWDTERPQLCLDVSGGRGVSSSGLLSKKECQQLINDMQKQIVERYNQ